jgi:hypothetical protein
VNEKNVKCEKIKSEQQFTSQNGNSCQQLIVQPLDPMLHRHSGSIPQMGYTADVGRDDDLRAAALQCGELPGP